MRLASALLTLALASAAAPALAGVYLAPSLRWSSFALRPQADEATPNYFGYGASFGMGYSLAQRLDLGGFYTHVPSRLESASVVGNDALLTSYGGELGLRLADSVFASVRGGYARYALTKQERPEEVPGRWTGGAGAVAIGAVSRLGKQSFFQTSLEVLHTVLQNDDATLGPGFRRLDAFALSFAYVYNAHQTFRFEDTIFRDYLDSMNFF